LEGLKTIAEVKLCSMEKENFTLLYIDLPLGRKNRIKFPSVIRR